MSPRFEVITEQHENIALLNAKIDDTSAKLEATKAELTAKIESTVQQATQGYTYRMDGKFKEYRMEAQKEMKDNFKRLSDLWNE